VFPSDGFDSLTSASAFVCGCGSYFSRPLAFGLAIPPVGYGWPAAVIAGCGLDYVNSKPCSFGLAMKVAAFVSFLAGAAFADLVSFLAGAAIVAFVTFLGA